MSLALRDTCEQDDGMQGYGWTTYDTRVGGSQTMHDTALNIDLTTDFFKSKGGSSWTGRVTGTPRPDAPRDITTTVVLHAAIEKAELDDTRILTCAHQSQGLRDRDDAEAGCRGEVPGLGAFEFYVMTDAENNPAHNTAVNSVQVPEGKIWQAKSVFMSQVNAGNDKSITVDDKPGAGNMQFIQMTFKGAFTLTFTYRGLEATPLDADGLEAGITDLESSFPKTVDKVFPRTRPFSEGRYNEFSRALVSNLLGGQGFFHGDSKVDYTRAPEYEETDVKFWEKAAAAMGRAEITTTPPTSLLSFTPSRPFFPRGFLWDEGFHLLPVIEWDLDLAVSVLKSWLSQMDEDGWIAREQILGPEARSRVPSQFQVQYPHYANPPALFMVIPKLLSKITGASAYAGHSSAYISSPDQASALIKEIYPLLVRNYNFFRRTQAGNFSTDYPRPEGAVPGEGYRWRGRTPLHTLTSGLDDYPRANPPHPAELHVDALAWVGASAEALRQAAEYLGEDADAATYKGHVSDVKKNLDVLHWDPEEQTYCDATVEGGAYKRVCHQGYVSLFPLFLGLLDSDHPNLPAVLDLLSDPNKLWSPYGLRSLSAAHPDYGTGEDYWRGAVWMQLNVLAVMRLRDLGERDRPGGQGSMSVSARAMSLAAELREHVVDTVYKGWVDTGFVWEQYDDSKGMGRHSRAFTGWTACVILLMGLTFPGGSGERRENVGSSLSAMPVVLVVVLAVLVVAFRRQITTVAAHVMNHWLTWRKSRVRRGQSYEQVIDLDTY
ncbi:related to mannosyl-oligosaccharide glucosidase [Cephalotrichum gorgonifer]|uniref:Mannosyl-oligosaccharide glucosidase n=1 Tax=Cephalotrichum gorgonifer TaxID=2041049 RepID=A0AAE8SYY4_9PEZI|nr:related to mannosyl-oligosaccharide glucosidase [Cephalotrichum gorgonifer]